MTKKKATTKVKSKLTTKQRKFADEYVKTGNATKAAISAGYSKKTAQQVGSENLSKPVIKQYIELQMKKIEDKKIMGAKEALEQITKIARGESVTQMYVTERDGKTSFTVTVDDYPSTTDVLSAAKEILKRYPLSELEKVQIKKAQAEAVKAQAEAEVAKAQVDQLNTVTDKAKSKIEKLSTEDLRNLAKMAGEDDD